MSFLTPKQMTAAVNFLEDAGRRAQELNASLAKSAPGLATKGQLREWPHRIAALNAQIKAGIGMVAAEATFGESQTGVAAIAGKAVGLPGKPQRAISGKAAARR